MTISSFKNTLLDDHLLSNIKLVGLIDAELDAGVTSRRNPVLNDHLLSNIKLAGCTNAGLDAGVLSRQSDEGYIDAGLDAGVPPRRSERRRLSGRRLCQSRSTQFQTGLDDIPVEKHSR